MASLRAFGCNPYHRVYGVCHGDDLNYLFPMDPPGFPARVVTENQKTVQRFLLDIVSTFSQSGDPSATNTLGGIWEPLEVNMFNVRCDHLCLPQADTGIAKYLKVDAPACTMENDDDLRSELMFWSQVRNTWIFYHLIFPGRSGLTPKWTTGGSVMKYQKYFMTKLPLKDD